MLSQSYTSKKAKSSQIEQSAGNGNQFYPGNDHMKKERCLRQVDRLKAWEAISKVLRRLKKIASNVVNAWFVRLAFRTGHFLLSFFQLLDQF